MNLEELMKDEELTRKIANAKDLDEVVKLLQDKGIEITTVELQNEFDTANEMNEVDLEDVAGGLGPYGIHNWIRKLVKRFLN